MDERIERKLGTIRSKTTKEEEPKQRALWSNKKIKKFDKMRYREQKCKEWEVRITAHLEQFYGELRKST